MNRHWLTIDDNFGFRSGSWEFQINPRQPERGAIVSQSGSGQTEQSPEVQIFALPTLTTGLYQPSESFIRLGDLHLNYAATKDLPTSVSLCWRLHNLSEWLPNLPPAEAAETLLAEVVISFQTDLLDAVPVRETHSRLPAGKFLPLPPPLPPRPGEIERPTSDTASLIESAGRLWLSAVYPSDLRWLAVSRQVNSIEQQFRLRAENLEKGVIRRLRCLFATAPDNSLPQLRELPQKFADSQLPLSF
jgi:hypothetical protein